MEDNVHRNARLGTSVLISAGWYNHLIGSLLEAEAKDIAATLLSDDAIPPNLILPLGTAERLRTISDLGQVTSRLDAALEQQQKFRDTANASFMRQDGAVTDFAVVSKELDRALRTADTVSQAGQITTRLAVIGLLIYLVQIVVNRYRYLQRLAGFYQARAQAFRLLAASSPDTPLLRNVTLADVTGMLSPNGISFDKSAESPTSQIVSLLQAGFRKT